MAVNTLQLDGMAISDVMKSIRDTGVGDSEASIILGNWLIQQGARQQRVFNYQTDFPATEPDCVETFTPTFHHTDWVDGESVVQAQQSAGEEGFNSRLRKIEQDFAAVRTDLGQVFACLAHMRAEIRSLLDELRTQINLINADLFNLAQAHGTYQPPSFPPVSFIPPFDATNAHFVGSTKYFDKDVAVWQTSQGTIMLPNVTPTPSNPASDPRVSGTASLAKFMTSNPQLLQQFGGKPITKADLIKNYGTQTLDNGMSVADAVSILPDTASYATPDVLVSDLAERQAGAIRSSGGSDVVNAALGVQGAPGAASGAAIANLPGLSSSAAAALSKSGITTVGQLAAANPTDITKALSTGGVAMNSGDVAATSALAKTLTHL
ncbi:hypothetical protein [Burkholderia pyrrocinia]|uniref:hypothetical protein n=1 Tax=Burkholderia pyrrocinia TaxID=60550 RepID=UPI001BD0C770|nr:hypothetical protein [Burkholderia pyrrocinia]QVN21771.1 hypothetical protein JYG32_20525 [Burkholderia pyrrocinia]